jgi:hypothetical protein
LEGEERFFRVAPGRFLGYVGIPKAIKRINILENKKGLLGYKNGLKLA